MYETRFLLALAFTVAIETAVLFAATGIFFREIGIRRNFPRVLITGALCSGFSLPYVWFVLPAFIQSKTAFALTAEAWAVIAEAVIIMWALRMKPSHSFLVSLACNACSFLLGKAAFTTGLL